MKKILVSGCANCPYFIAWNDGEGNGFASISSGECCHPSFQIRKDLPATIMSRSVFLEEDLTKDDNPIIGVKANGIPCWCPLPEEIQIYNPTNIKC